MPANKSEHRRSSKPLMEKRRRARINQSLGELKSFILETAKKENCRRSKLEKADILELTVKHLQNLHKNQHSGTENSKVTGKFVAGFNQCVTEVNKFVSTIEGIDSNVQNRLVSHLNKCITTLDPTNENGVASGQLVVAGSDICNSSSTVSSTTICQPLSTIYPVKIEVPSETTPKYSMNVLNGFQVITTSRLPSGDVALIVPSNALSSKPSASSSSPSHSTSSSPITVVPMVGADLSSPGLSTNSDDIDNSKSLPSSPKSENGFYWGQPEQTSPLSLSHRPDNLIEKNSINCHNNDQMTDSSVWRPW